ncbi:transient receptor potential cation channel trpm isoform X4 [Drosophila kikkawai]|uniref:Transient receptor potential cation channel trpm isoform X4 n=1 Tax=Drosophila kikkawai TaxID=30033 RepID=A0ABM3C7H1_DROKI|nr:transient receptor potential cation channel trpm isoform X4 [Drosophila kikkawai]XP_041632702.1 transient receptor potential cation channel trpm isoform X4 [Drosophila kikkawai]XP_041632703.1 transient receptor potential cation channel trpm isoform X4 [Drosophila kikkawai]XP_041632704.1 transient receptor potential cation channel trpm isoform X4 [Drosophila kikkawai]
MLGKFTSNHVQVYHQYSRPVPVKKPVKHQPRSWIETNFQKRECIKFIPCPKDDTKCCCGQVQITHQTIPGIESGSPGDLWLPTKHTRPQTTDAYGTIEFQGGAHPTKAQYVRLSFDTRPELLVQLFTKEWNLELPKLLITVQGGKANFDLQAKLKKEIRKGLLKAAKTTGAWIFTGGTNTGVTKQVGDALLLEGQQRTGRVVSIGIAPWGIVERNHELLGHNREVPCHSISSPRSKLAVLNNRHAYFLLVDNGTQAKYGAELILRRKLEKFISNLKLHPFTHSSTPVVCLVIEGGTNTIRAVLEYVTDSPPVPVVVCDGSGRAADLLAFVHKYASDGEEQPVLESMRDYLIGTIQKTFEVGLDQSEKLYHELLQCTRNKNLITVFRIQEKPEGEAQELDQTILTALFKSQHLSPPEQLSLALTWNRVDIARSEIFVYGQEWPNGALDEAMMQALEHDRIDFVKLLLENGVSMKKFLTIPRLEELYNTKHGPANTLGYILRDVRPHIPKGYIYTLHDIGLVINKLMGGAYRSYYTRRKFRPIYAKVMNSYANACRKSSTYQYQRYAGANSLSLVTGLLPFTSEMALFEFPFNELLIWAVLTKRQQMALLMWTHGEEALAKSLVSCKLYKAMAHEAAEDDLDTEIYEELRSYAKEFESKGNKLLDFSYRQDAEKAQRLLTCELHSWSNQSCLSLAVAANHRALLAHPCSQVILADLWMGGLRTRKNTNFKVILGLAMPLYIRQLDFKTKEELQQMPQTEEEHLENQNLDNDDSDRSQPDAEALLADTYSVRDTKVHENGKVSLTDSDPAQFREFFNLSEYNEVKQHQPLRLKKKFYEFYTAPITKFWADSIAYMFFLIMFSFTVLVKMETMPRWQEWYSIAYITTLGFEKVREIISSEPVAITHKFSVWAWNMWNPCDGAAIILFLIGLAFRFRDTTMDIGRVIYCVDSIYWYLRILNILGVNKYLGPLVTMMGKMVKNMIYFVVLLAVVLMSFGVSRQAILYPDKQPTWGLIKEVTFQPYFMLYGEVFAGDIDPPCGEDPSQPGCVTGHWVTPITMSMYLLIANILLINLLIAVFNNIFNEVNSVSHQVWMFQRFTVVMEYQQKPVLPPPFIALCHFYSLLKYCVRKAKGLEVQRDNGLKLFLEKDDLERLYDFEEECVEGFFHEQEIILNQSTDERVKNTTERVETMSQKIEDINQKENIQTATVQNIEFRLRKMEESSEQILSHLAVIHRFMSTHIAGTDDLRGSTINIPSEMHRMRTISISDTEGGGNGSGGAGGGGSGSGGGGGAIVPLALGAGLNLNSLQVTTRRRFNRSLTEVRPDAYIFDEGTHFEVVPLPEEPDEVVKSREALNEQVVRKASMQSEADSDIYLPLSQRPSTCETVKRTPYVTVRQDTGASTESKDTLTPMGNDDDQTLVGGDNSDDAAPDINFEAARHRALRQRTVSLCRRNSETYSLTGADFNRSHISLNQLASLSRRQMSLTQSEPDSDKDMPAAAGGSSSAHPGKSVLHAKPSRNILLKLHSEYTSITDELESVCHMIASPTVSLQSNKASLDRPKTEMSRAEAAALLEKKHLKECEENDYKILEGLIEARGSIDASAQPFEIGVSIDYSHRYPLRRETAVELSPSKPSVEGDLMGGATGGAASGGGGDSSDTSGAGSCGAMVVVSSGFQLKNERPWQRNSSMEQQTYPSPLVPTRATSDFLNPPYEGSGRLFKKSSESLQKNSSTETDYSAHPYRFIKQSSNETNTSLTGSYNVDTPSLTAEPSLDAGDSHSATGISISVGAAGGAATARYQPIRTASVGAADGRRLRDESSSSLDLSSGGTTGPVTMQAAPAPPSRPMLLKKQFSVDQGKPSQPAEATATATGMATATAQTPEPAQVGAKLISTLKPQPFASKLGMNVLKESSSSTEESGCSSAKSSNPALSIPQISTHLVQDEIAKLSSNIKSSTESEKDPPFNETMC